MRSRRERGFTLLEVLVALAIATLGIAGITLSAITAGANASSLREQSLAHWVAMNKATELRLSQDWPALGSSDGDSEFAGVEWRWQAEVSETDVEALRRADITVSYAQTPDDEITRLSVFIKQPTPDIDLRPWSGYTQQGPGTTP